ncbi:cyclic nucleotide-binding domain-containing protein [Marmoricola sp. RAF53]|uniref:cyclic nucleotide-binding domain-containing protein n=1 Tax=Marmoricola sp. RAF53 TaxID=3233059 RepID=UPI003F94759C
MRLHKDAKAELIRSIPLFAGCTPDEIHEVAAIADEVDLRQGKRLTTENTEGREFVVIIDGTAEVHKGDEVINRIGPGEWVGEIALLTGTPRTATVVATAPVHALVIEGHRFTQLMEHAPQIRAKIEKVLAERTG